ncbi:MAG: deoxyribodipyrimidine photo-lyase [Micavibrio aeruginosavorus]|uniref:Deoxyribodipyrimidine photo-lyase n=1 Tax=Micavibrio aeruginosavorus TaxID=349221 RepID=A0A7T5UH61_9BACT|nr:MAG: deoxyribodipyrimidine photo-lyase [Micavibrio aeruginosavorus]
MPAENPIIVWFRQDLRLADNPALLEAAQKNHPIIPVYVLDDINAGAWKMGRASCWWLHHSLHALQESLSKRLVLIKGDASEVIPYLAHDTKAAAVYWNRCYEPWRIDRDTRIKSTLEAEGIEVKNFNASLLFEPWEIRKTDGAPYRAFTPFFRRGCLGTGEPDVACPAPSTVNLASNPEYGVSLENLNLLPQKPMPRWDTKMESYWEIGEAGAQKKLKDFLKTALRNYREGRNIPSQNNVSRLSPHLHFGEISPRSVWHAIKRCMITEGLETDGDHFLNELGWREFSYNLLYYNRNLPLHPLQERFQYFPWERDDESLQAWQRGKTGYPIVDAGMRELWETGYMHNRVRMIVGSFLVKDLLIPWQQGEEWFWDCLVDADLANNAASWQWIAGCGADAAPYFRIFNPVGQGEKFDPNGTYVRRWCPELSKLPDEWIHRPWEAPPLLLRECGISLGCDYPYPIVDHKKARVKALTAFQAIRGMS